MPPPKEIAQNIITWCQLFREETDSGRIEVLLNTVMGSNDHEFYLALNEVSPYANIAPHLSARHDIFERLKVYRNSGILDENPYFKRKPPETRWYKKIARVLWGCNYERVV